MLLCGSSVLDLVPKNRPNTCPSLSLQQAELEPGLMIPVSVQSIRPHNHIFIQIKSYTILKIVNSRRLGNYVNTPVWFRVCLRSVKHACDWGPHSGVCGQPLGWERQLGHATQGQWSRQFSQRGQFAHFHSKLWKKRGGNQDSKQIVCIWSELWDGKQPTYFFPGVFYI